MSIRRMLVLAWMALLWSPAHACLFATTTPAEGWYQWASGLFAGEVTGVGKDVGKPVDVITVAVVETFKGPDASRGTLTVYIPSRHWASCKLEVPAVGALVLVAINPNSDAMLVPLSQAYAEQLRAYRR
jgi:hypothetical protein